MILYGQLCFDYSVNYYRARTGVSVIISIEIDHLFYHPKINL